MRVNGQDVERCPICDGVFHKIVCPAGLWMYRYGFIVDFEKKWIRSDPEGEAAYFKARAAKSPRHER